MWMLALQALSYGEPSLQLLPMLGKIWARLQSLLHCLYVLYTELVKSIQFTSGISQKLELQCASTYQSNKSNSSNIWKLQYALPSNSLSYKQLPNSLHVMLLQSFPIIKTIRSIRLIQYQIITLKNQIGMNSSSILSIPQIYSFVSHTDGGGIEGYHVEKKYVDPIKQMKDRDLLSIKKGQKDRRHVTKRGNYLEDQQKAHKVVPGPGQYSVVQDWPEQSKLKIAYPNKQTYVDEIMKREKKEKKPAPGQYNVTKSLKQLDAQKKKLASKKIPVQDRITYLDQVQYEANQLPGVGNYNPREKMKTQVSHLKTKPQDWRKKHEQQSLKKPEKSPDMRTYKPSPSEYLLFENLSKKKLNKNFLGRVERFKTMPEGSGLNPAKYNVLQAWRGKQVKNEKVTRHGLEVLSTKTTHKSVYYH